MEKEKAVFKRIRLSYRGLGVQLLIFFEKFLTNLFRWDILVLKRIVHIETIQRVFRLFKYKISQII